MSQKQKKSLLLLTILILLLSACGGGGSTNNEPAVADADAVLTQAAEIAIQGLTQTAAAAPPTATPLPTDPPASDQAPTAAPLASPTQNVIPTNALSDALTASPTPAAIFTQAAASSATPVTVLPSATPVPVVKAPDCWRAKYESESPPYDGHVYEVGKTFTKMWRIKNIGSCTWDNNVDLVWVETLLDGKSVVELFDASSVNPISIPPVLPGQHVEIELEFEIDELMEWGTYQVFFKLRSPDGVFGVSGDGSLWFIIKVISQ